MAELETYDWSKKTVLIVEDNVNNYDLLVTFLKYTKAKILWEKDGGEAVDVCKSRDDIDLILMDIQLTTVSGFEATQMIREFNKEIIIVAQTAYAMVGDREKSLQAGCNDYLSKPIRKKLFLATLANYLS